MIKPKNGFLCTTVIWTTLLLFSLPALGQPPEDRLRMDVKAGTVTMGEVEDSEAEVGINWIRTSVKYSYFTVGYEQRRYIWENEESLPFGNGSDEPWERLHRLFVRARYSQPLDKQWRYFVGGGAYSGFEKTLSSNLGVSAFGGVTYIYSPDLWVSLGAMVSSHKVRNRLLPMMGIVWNPGSREGFSGGIGMPKSFIKYHFVEELSLKLAFGLNNAVFELDEESTVAQNGFMETQGVTPGLFLEFTPSRRVGFEIGTQYFINDGFRLYDENGDEMGSYDVDNRLGYMAGLFIRF